MANYYLITFTVDSSDIAINGDSTVLLVGDKIQFTSFSGPTNIEKETIYFIVSKTGSNYEISTELNGTPITIDADGTGIAVIADVTSEDDTEDVEDNGGDKPDPPQAPAVGDAETALRNNRIRFDWDPPDEDNPAYDENDGLRPGQSHAVKYKITVQKNNAAPGDPADWVDVETKKTANTYYVYHAAADPAVVTNADLLKEYRALIYSIDVRGVLSDTYFNTNAKGLGAGDGGGKATVAPDAPIMLPCHSRLNGIMVRWQDGNTANSNEPSDDQQPIRYIILMASSANGTYSKIGVTDGESFLATENANGNAFTKSDVGTTLYFKVRAKNAVGTALSSSSYNSSGTFSSTIGYSSGTVKSSISTKTGGDVTEIF
ncbi:MAG: hypothetical protein ACKO7N_09415, partial [Candidatus Nitrosotenuis sp.]